MVAMVTRRPHWQITDPKLELRPWSADAASLLSSIPERYVTATVQGASYMTVGIGMYSLVAPRLAMDQLYRQQATEGAAVAEAQRIVSTPTAGPPAEAPSYQYNADGTPITTGVRDDPAKGGAATRIPGLYGDGV